MTCPHAFPSLAIPLIGMRVRVQVQAHTILMPIPAAIDAMIAAIEQEDIADDAPLATVASDAATDAVDIITIAADVARARAAAEPAHAGAACVTGARGGRAVRAGCRVPHHRGGPSGRQGGRRQGDRRRPLLPRVEGQHSLQTVRAPGTHALARRARTHVADPSVCL